MSPKGRNASRDDHVKLWEGDFIICKLPYHCVNMRIKRVDCLYNSINRSLKLTHI